MLRVAKILGLGVALAMATPSSADFKSGMTAWEKGDYAKAVKEWKVAATAGDADAQFNLGQAYRPGLGVTKDPQQAEDLFQKAAAQNQPRAQLLYATILLDKGKPQEAMSWLEKSAMRGDKDAQFQLGVELYQGKNIARDLVRAYVFMKIADTASQAKARDVLPVRDVQPVMEKAVPADQKAKAEAMVTQITAAIARTQAQMLQQAVARANAAAAGGAPPGGAPAIGAGE